MNWNNPVASGMLVVKTCQLIKLVDDHMRLVLAGAEARSSVNTRFVPSEKPYRFGCNSTVNWSTALVALPKLLVTTS